METLAQLTFAVVGSVELVKRLFGKDWQASAVIVVAALVGALLGPQIGVSWFSGLVIGLGASGIVTTVSKIGN